VRLNEVLVRNNFLNIISVLFILSIKITIDEAEGALVSFV
jgi:hypothetical protein